MDTARFMKSGAELIAAERTRQVSQEGWTPEHDAKHKFGELLKAAVCYAVGSYTYNRTSDHPMDGPPAILYEMSWPWDMKYWKPGTHIRMLVKAGALIAAEIDRRIATEAADAEELSA